MQITLLGAAGEVTGSCYLVTTSRAQVLVDCGLFQGSGKQERRNQVPRSVNMRSLDAVVLTHAHLDHTGRLPLLIRKGYRRPIYATPASAEIADLLLHDMAHLQESDARRANSKRQRAGQAPVVPLFSEHDVETTLKLFRDLPYEQAVEVAPGISVRMVESGHILGSASIQMIVEDQGRRATVVFSGDIGPLGAPLLNDPLRLDTADLVIMESTYGDRDHRPLEATVAEFAAAVQRALTAEGKILVPAFAVGRSQQILYHLAELFQQGELPAFPVFLDSPLAIKATDLYMRHPELDDAAAQRLRRAGEYLRDMDMLKVTPTADDSRALNNLRGPCMIIAGSGMATGGRILHHLKHNLWRPETAVLIVGYQAGGTLGRLLVDGAPRVKIFGEPIAVRASIHTLGGFSAHAGQNELLYWLEPLAARRPHVLLTHGEDRARLPLAGLIEQRYGIAAQLPELDDSVSIAGGDA